MNHLISQSFTMNPNEILSDNDLKPMERLTYLALQSFAGRDTFCYPSHKALMIQTGIKSHNTLKKALNGLEVKGYIEIKSQRSESGRKCGVDTYYLKYIVAPKKTEEVQIVTVSKNDDAATKQTFQNLNTPSKKEMSKSEMDSQKGCQNLNKKFQNLNTGTSKIEDKKKDIKTKYKNINNNSTNTSSANTLNSNTRNDLAETSTAVSQILDTLEFNLGKRFPANAKCGNDRIADLIDKRIEEGWTVDEVCDTINFMVRDFKNSTNDMTPSCNPWSILGRFFNEYATKLRVFKRVSKRRKEQEPKHIPIVNSWQQGNLFECMA